MSARNRLASSKKTLFPQKLWELVNDQRLESAIRWTNDGHTFLVYENQLIKLCLGKENNMFYTSQPKSFVRQLHLYGFRKINKHEFKHENFRRDRPDLLCYIKRAYSKRSSTSDSMSTVSPQVSTTSGQGSTSDNQSYVDQQVTQTALVDDQGYQIHELPNEQDHTYRLFDISSTNNALREMTNTCEPLEVDYYNEDSILRLYEGDEYPYYFNDVTL